jgi:hypothetical protein
MNELSDFFAYIYRANLATLALIIGEVRRIQAERVGRLEIAMNMKRVGKRDSGNPAPEVSSASCSTDAFTENP